MKEGVIAAKAKMSEGEDWGKHHLVVKVIVVKHGRRREKRKRKSAEVTGASVRSGAKNTHEWAAKTIQNAEKLTYRRSTSPPPEAQFSLN